ncbi:hypothetical protein ACQZ6B_05770 [Agrobacterium vitis]
MKIFEFKLQQHPVGQGGFHTGWIFDGYSPYPRFCWAYDCGSNQKKELEHEIKYVKEAHFDVLFLSHLDDDHVNGVETLLKETRGVKEVVLPHLSDRDWVLHLAKEASSGTLSTELIDLAEDPAGWFGSRGVERVTYVEASDDDDDDETPTSPDSIEPTLGEPPSIEGREGRLDWSRDPRVLEEATSSSSASVSLVESGSVAKVSFGSHNVSWILTPYAFRPSSNQLQLFEKELKETFGHGRSNKDYMNEARQDKGREKLRDCYNKIWKNHNLHSMALYAGPVKHVDHFLYSTAWHGDFYRPTGPSGWLSTGDFDLSVNKRRTKLIRYFEVYKNLIRHLTLPHHGSDASFHVDILCAYPRLLAAIAATGPNTYNHPGPKLQNEIAKISSINFVRVDQNPSSKYFLEGFILT